MRRKRYSICAMVWQKYTSRMKVDLYTIYYLYISWRGHIFYMFVSWRSSVAMWASLLLQSI